MIVTVSPFWLPKADNAAHEYDDAFWPRQAGEFGGDPIRLAVADGATEGLLGGRWADTLARAYCGFGDGWVTPPRLLDAASREWAIWRREYLDERNRSGRPIQWFEEPGLEAGAYAAFLGVHLSAGGHWHALALGDCCLFQVRGNALAAAFPLSQSAQFNSRPLLVASNPARNGGVLEAFGAMSGEWQAHDTFYLMTDALAEWFLRGVETGQAPWATLDYFGGSNPQQDFAIWIDGLRNLGVIRNDDVTLLCVRLSA